MISTEQSGRHTATWGYWDFQSGCLIPSGKNQKALPRGWPLNKNIGDWKMLIATLRLCPDPVGIITLTTIY